MQKVAFLGLGAMGAPMATRLLSAGFPLVVWNRTPEKAAALVAAGAQLSPTPRQAAEIADVVATMLSDPAALDAVALGVDGILSGLGPGKVWLDFSTVAPADARRLAGLARARGAEFCDVPVAGSVVPAREGTLTILAGGEASTLESAREVLATLSKQVLHVGPAGQGAAMKLVNNLLYGVSLAAFGEALLLAEELGVGADRAAAWILTTPAAPPYARTKLDFLKAGGAPPHFSVALMEKDLGLMADAARSELAVTSAAADAYRKAKQAGLGDADLAHVISHIVGRSLG